MNPHGQRFSALIAPHLDAAYNLARWITGQDAEARDAVQDAAIRALRYIDRLAGSDGRPWFLAIVRNVCLAQIAARRRDGSPTGLDDLEETASFADPNPLPDELLERAADRVAVNRVLAGLSVPLREVLILREMEELSYEEIARITNVPIGTVMSRLSRGRAQFRAAFARAAESPVKESR